MFRTPSHRAQGWLIAGGILAAALILGAVAGLSARDNDSDEPVEPARAPYIEAVTGTWQRINPLLAGGNPVDRDLSALIFSTLVRAGPDGVIEGDLADLPDISPDGLTYRFVLREGAAWHDGRAVSSADVAFTIGLIQSAGFSGTPGLVEAWSGVTVDTPDEVTVVLTLPEPSAPFLARSAAITGILPAHLLEGTSGAALGQSAFNTRPVGSGPYRLETLDATQATLIAHAGYHLGAPILPSIQFRFASEQAAAVDTLLAGDADAIFFPTPPSEGTAAELAATGRLTARSLPGSAYLVLYLNNDQAAFFLDPSVRRAIDLAIDREALAELTGAEQARPSSSPIAPGTWAYAGEHDHRDADLEQARTLLAEAGWTIAPGSGVLTREGNELRFTLRVDDDPVRIDIAAAVADQLDQLGIRVTVASTTATVLQRDFLQTRRYDAAIAGWEQGPDPDGYAAWHSSQVGSAGLNIANFRNVVVDEILTSARRTSDENVRVDLYRQFQEVWEDRVPSPVLLYPAYTWVYPEDLEGTLEGVLFDPSQRFYDVQLWQR